MKQSRNYALLMLRKAADDLLTADAILQMGKAYANAGFHAQQAAEKSLKAFLDAYEIEYPRTHDLGQLLALTLAVSPEMIQFKDSLLPLNRFAVEARYSDEYQPFEREAHHFFEVADTIYRYVVRHLELGYENPEDWYYDSQE